MQEEGNKPCQDHSKVSKFHELFASSIHVTGRESRCVTVSIRTNHHHRWILHKNSIFQKQVSDQQIDENPSRLKDGIKSNDEERESEDRFSGSMDDGSSSEGAREGSGE